MALREYLQEQERALLKQLDELRAEIGALQLKLIPLEAELAEVRRAAAAIGVPAPVSSEKVGFGSLGSLAGLVGLAGPASPGGFESAGNDSLHSELGYAAIVAANSATRRANTAVEDALADFVQRSPPSSPYAHLTMKQLVVKALEERFRLGATTRQLIEFFQDAWGRKIERTNLSPQLSRLYQDGEIGRIRSTRGWFLIQRSGIVVGFRPYLDRGRIIWKGPETATDQDEPLLTRDIEAAGIVVASPYKRTTTTEMPNGLIDRRATFHWLLPQEARPDDAPVLRHEFPPPDDYDFQTLEEIEG